MDQLITWVSNNPALISNDGQTVNRPAYGSGNATATLTATITKNSVSDTKIFNLTVLEATPKVIPTVTTDSATTGDTSATLSGTITSTGGADVTTRGFQYGLTNSYTDTASETGIFSTGSYNANILSLTCNTTYHYRAYAINSVGTSYGSDTSFTTNSCKQSSSAPVQLPHSIGAGSTEVSISMNNNNNIGIINTNGVNILAYINSQAIFSTPQISETHSITISNLDLATNIITLTIASNPQIITLKEGETKLVDLNNDSINDLQLTFTNIYINRAEIFAKAITNVISTPTSSAVPVTSITTTPSIPTKIIKTFIFTKDLKLNSVGSDVKELQKFLNTKGYIVTKQGAGSKGKETTKFGPATKAALIKFQKANKINPVSGLFGSTTRKIVNATK